jgi:RNA polymerase sigma-70 factor (ECF subfamily)
MNDETIRDAAPRGDLFLTTRWSLVLHAGREHSPHSERALAELCEVYWYPLYAYIRRQGASREDAEDLTQGFFESFLRSAPLEGLSAERGKFRAFLLASLKHFLSNERDKARRLKRGGGAIHLSLDWHGADDRFHLDQPAAGNPDRAFDREWAVTLLDRVVHRLAGECAASGKAAFFEQVKGLLTGSDGTTSYAEAGRALSMDEGAVRVAVHRLRKRFRVLLRDEVGHTLLDPGQVDQEMEALQSALLG